MRFAVSLVAPLLLCQCGAAPESEFATVELANSTVLRIDGRDFATYRFDGTTPVVYPVHGPGGHPMTRGYPIARKVGEAADHPHHVSLWFAHGAVNGHDFWHGAGERRILHDGFVEGAGDGELATRNRWLAGEELVCTDERRLAWGKDGAAWFLDYEVTIHASAGPLRFGDTKEGTMAIRVAAPLRVEGEVAQGHLLDGAGHRDRAVWGKRAPWVASYGTVDEDEVGVAIFDHPDNPRHPTWWHARPYGLVAANPFGVHDFERAAAGTGDLEVAAGDSLRFRYRFWFFEGGPETADVAAAYARYTED